MNVWIKRLLLFVVLVICVSFVPQLIGLVEGSVKATGLNSTGSVGLMIGTSLLLLIGLIAFKLI